MDIDNGFQGGKEGHVRLPPFLVRRADMVNRYIVQDVESENGEPPYVVTLTSDCTDVAQEIYNDDKIVDTPPNCRHFTIRSVSP